MVWWCTFCQVLLGASGQAWHITFIWQGEPVESSFIIIWRVIPVLTFLSAIKKEAFPSSASSWMGHTAHTRMNSMNCMRLAVSDGFVYLWLMDLRSPTASGMGCFIRAMKSFLDYQSAAVKT